jgi:hypothetical protein
MGMIVAFCLLCFASSALAQDGYRTTKRSGMVKSGAKNNWSPWIVVDADAAKPGFVIANVEFGLEGDRRCNAHAECVEIYRNEYFVSWKFKLQGHDEVGPLDDGVRTSEGILTVTYIRLPVQLSDSFTVRRESGGMWSGRGTAFGCILDHFDGKIVMSGPCTLESYPPPRGYVIESSSFHLEGDRRCGRFSHCTQVANSPTRHAWTFDMQGHEGQPPLNTQGRYENSWGVLTIRYVKQP